jgi:DNA replication protein DnaC
MVRDILSHYDIFTSKIIQTEITINLSASEIAEKYGNRVCSRLREMLNLIAFHDNSVDKRV